MKCLMTFHEIGCVWVLLSRKCDTLHADLFCSSNQVSVFSNVSSFLCYPKLSLRSVAN